MGVTVPAIDQWIHGRRLVPLQRCVEIQGLTRGRVTVEDLRPDLAEVFAAVKQSKKARQKG